MVLQSVCATISVLVVICFRCVQSQPECRNYNVLSSSDRSQQHKGDTYGTDDNVNGWYRFTGAAGYAMPTSCTREYHCGAHGSGWMQGLHPSAADGVVTRTACFHWSGSCCQATYSIRVRNCGGFYVYQLASVGNRLRYCGNGAVSKCTAGCSNGGTCLIDQSGGRCHCPVGSTGSTCQTVYGTNVTCETNYMEIQMDRNVFGDNDPQDFHLKSKSCRARLEGDKLRLRTPLDGCGTTHEQTDQTITYWNEVSTYYKGQDGRNGSTVIRTRNVHFPFYCKYGRRKTVSTSYSHIGTYFASEGSYGNFTFKMELFPNKSYSSSYGPRDYPVSVGINEPLFIQYSVSSTTADLVVFAEECRATTTGNPNSSPQYAFIKAGCAVDNTMTYNYQLGRVQRFTIDSFRFVANHPVVYLHCELMVCHRNASNSRCAQGCQNSKRARRDAIDGSMRYDLSTGALARKAGGQQEKQSGGEDKPSSVLVVVGATFGGLFFLVTIMLLLLIRHNKRHNKVGVVISDVTTTAHALVDVVENEGKVTM